MSIDKTNDVYRSLGLTHDQTKTTKNNDMNALGQEDFMKLMVTQMSNQDPFKPMDNAEFIAQMAQFSSVSSLNDLTKSFGTLASSMQSSQALQASSLVGRNILVPSAVGPLPEAGNLAGAVDLPFSTSDLSVSIKDPVTGDTVRSIAPNGSQSAVAGTVQFEWDGLDDQGNRLPAGNYIVEASAVASDGTGYALDTLISAPVESVTLGQGGRGVSLNVTGMGSMDLSAVRQIL